MSSLSLYSIDPQRLKLETPTALILASGFCAESGDRLRRNPSPEAAADLCSSLGDATVIYVTLDHGRACRLDAWRGVSSGYELFFAIRPDGSIIFSDHFRNILAQLNGAERLPTETAILDHLLFRTVPGIATYSRAVERLGHGEHVAFALAQAEVHRKTFDRVECSPRSRAVQDYVDAVDASLTRTVARFASRPKLVSMFSGGIDSSLLRTFLPEQTRNLFYEPEATKPGTPDCTVPANAAAKHLKITLEQRRLHAKDIWRFAEQNVEMAAWPQRVLQTVMYADAITRDADAFVSGERADCLFGGAGTAGALGSSVAARLLGEAGWRAAAGLPAKTLASAAAKVLQTTSRLKAHPYAPEGWAASVTGRGYSDYAILSDIVGEELVRERLSKRLEYVLERVALDERASALYRHLELGHWIMYMPGAGLGFLRQLTLAHRKNVYLPFLARPVVEAAMTIPVEQRYTRHFQVKYLLKALLKRKVPSFPLGQKGITAVATPETYNGHDRAALWEEYPITAFIPKKHHEKIKGFENPISFPTYMLSLLEKKALRNPALTVLQGTEILTYRIAEGADTLRPAPLRGRSGLV